MHPRPYRSSAALIIVWRARAGFVVFSKQTNAGVGGRNSGLMPHAATLPTRPGIIAGSQTVLKLSFNRPDLDLTRIVCVECLFLKSPSRAPDRTPSACAKRATYPDPPPVLVPHPESLAAQAAYTEALLPGSRGVGR